MDTTTPRGDSRHQGDANPRAVLRVPEVLMAVAAAPSGAQLPDLVEVLGLPKTSLHRILRTLETGGFLVREGKVWRCGPESLRLGRLLSGAAEAAGFPACARPELERLARATSETAMLSELAGGGRESVYVEVIESPSPLRFAMRPGNRRPLYAVASGQAMLAFQSADAQARYLAQTDFIQFTPETATRQTMAAQLAEAAAHGVVMDRNGMIEGASAIASPLFDAEGRAFAALSVAGPTERIERNRAEIAIAVHEAAARVSRLIGFAGAYPAAPDPGPANR